MTMVWCPFCSCLPYHTGWGWAWGSVLVTTSISMIGHGLVYPVHFLFLPTPAHRLGVGLGNLLPPEAVLKDIMELMMPDADRVWAEAYGLNVYSPDGEGCLGVWVVSLRVWL